MAWSNSGERRIISVEWSSQLSVCSGGDILFGPIWVVWSLQTVECWGRMTTGGIMREKCSSASLRGS